MQKYQKNNKEVVENDNTRVPDNRICSGNKVLKCIEYL